MSVLILPVYTVSVTTLKETSTVLVTQAGQEKTAKQVGCLTLQYWILSYT